MSCMQGRQADPVWPENLKLTGVACGHRLTAILPELANRFDLLDGAISCWTASRSSSSSGWCRWSSACSPCRK
ncbi:hypothetical protein MPLA_1280017 [Mesorhizobium sp. ORS 3359]|nr:hypothetical protein MPLA_1280017 [Mesorhizobium sp. ORS 3359]